MVPEAVSCFPANTFAAGVLLWKVVDRLMFSLYVLYPSGKYPFPFAQKGRSEGSI